MLVCRNPEAIPLLITGSDMTRGREGVPAGISSEDVPSRRGTAMGTYSFIIRIGRSARPFSRLFPRLGNLLNPPLLSLSPSLPRAYLSPWTGVVTSN